MRLRPTRFDCIGSDDYAAKDNCEDPRNTGNPARPQVHNRSSCGIVCIHLDNPPILFIVQNLFSKFYSGAQTEVNEPMSRLLLPIRRNRPRFALPLVAKVNNIVPEFLLLGETTKTSASGNASP